MKKLIVFFLFFFLISLTIVTKSQGQNFRNVVIEYTTSTQCGGCPCLDSVLQQIVLIQHPRSIIIACHTPWSHFGGYHGQLITDSLNSAGGDPQAYIDRTIYNVEGFDAFVDSVNSRFDKQSLSPVKLEVTAKSYNRSTRELTIELDAQSLSDTLNGLFRISFAIVENHIMYPQSHHPPCSGGPDYIHYDVLRNMVNNVYGDTVVNGVWPNGQTFHKTFTTVIDSSWVEDNCDFIFYVFKQQPGPLRKLYDYNIQQGIRFPVAHGVGYPEMEQEKSLVKIYPNPASDKVNIHLSLQKETNVDLRMFNINGKEITTLVRSTFKPGAYNIEVNTSGLDKGVYHIALKTELGVSVSKLIIL